MRRSLSMLLLLAAFAVLAAFLLGADAIDREFAYGIDAGVLAAAVSLVGIASAALLWSEPNARPRLLPRLSLLAAAAWLPASILLAGGTRLHYSGWRSGAWLALTAAILAMIVAGWISVLRRRAAHPLAGSRTH